MFTALGTNCAGPGTYRVQFRGHPPAEVEAPSPADAVMTAAKQLGILSWEAGSLPGVEKITGRDYRRAPESTVAGRDGPRGKARKKGTVNQRMLERYLREPESVDWSQEKWAEVLGCSPGRIGQVAAWQTILAARAIREADALRRAERRRLD
jgi:hypothetical protein